MLPAFRALVRDVGRRGFHHEAHAPFLGDDVSDVVASLTVYNSEGFELGETALIGKAKELFVATLLVSRRLHVYIPLVDHGFDLIATTADGTRFLPIQVKYKASRSGFVLDRADGEKFAAAGAVLAFGSGEADVKAFYFIPAVDWLQMATPRGDGKLVVYLKKSLTWAQRYQGTTGIELAFKSLL